MATMIENNSVSDFGNFVSFEEVPLDAFGTPPHAPSVKVKVQHVARRKRRVNHKLKQDEAYAKKYYSADDGDDQQQTGDENDDDNCNSFSSLGFTPTSSTLPPFPMTSTHSDTAFVRRRKNQRHSPTRSSDHVKGNHHANQLDLFAITPRAKRRTSFTAADVFFNQNNNSFGSSQTSGWSNSPPRQRFFSKSDGEDPSENFDVFDMSWATEQFNDGDEKGGGGGMDDECGSVYSRLSIVDPQKRRMTESEMDWFSEIESDAESVSRRSKKVPLPTRPPDTPVGVQKKKKKSKKLSKLRSMVPEDCSETTDEEGLALERKLAKKKKKALRSSLTGASVNSAGSSIKSGDVKKSKKKKKDKKNREKSGYSCSEASISEFSEVETSSRRGRRVTPLPAEDQSSGHDRVQNCASPHSPMSDPKRTSKIGSLVTDILDTEGDCVGEKKTKKKGKKSKNKMKEQEKDDNTQDGETSSKVEKEKSAKEKESVARDKEVASKAKETKVKQKEKQNNTKEKQKEKSAPAELDADKEGSNSKSDSGTIITMSTMEDAQLLEQARKQARKQVAAGLTPKGSKVKVKIKVARKGGELSKSTTQSERSARTSISSLFSKPATAKKSSGNKETKPTKKVREGALKKDSSSTALTSASNKLGGVFARVMNSPAPQKKVVRDAGASPLSIKSSASGGSKEKKGGKDKVGRTKEKLGKTAKVAGKAKLAKKKASAAS